MKVRYSATAAADVGDILSYLLERSSPAAAAVGEAIRRETFADFLAEQGLLEEARYIAIREIIADQIKVAMDKKGLSKTAMAARMKPAGGSSTGCLIRLIDR